MSRGFGAHADLVAQDNETVIYQYGGYNLNEPEKKETAQHTDTQDSKSFPDHIHCQAVQIRGNNINRP